MTIAHPMRRATAAFAFAALLTLLTTAASGCRASRPALPVSLVSPYPGQTEVVWAAAPLRNESGVSIVDELAVTDALVNEVQSVLGITCLPVNRTLGAMRALRLPSVNSPEQALALARALGVDGILVGTITAWDPYDPPTLGLSIAVFGQSATMRTPQPAALNAESIRSAPSDTAAGAAVLTAPLGPLSVVSEVYDASDGETREAVRRYAEGRHDPKSALAWKRYTASMGLYAKFACFDLVERLLDSERARLAGLAARAETTTPP